MTVRVKRMTLKAYQAMVKLLGHSAVTMNVPSTIDGIHFLGTYTTPSCDEIAVAWPIDRPEQHQTEYSEKYHCGYPVDEFDIEDTLN